MKWLEELGIVYKSQNDTYFVEVPIKGMNRVWTKLKEMNITRISSITVNDIGNELEVIYHFVYGKSIINIKTIIDAKKPQVKSIVEQFPGAELIEREIWETMGVEPIGHPNLKNFILDEKLSPKKPGLRRK